MDSLLNKLLSALRVLSRVAVILALLAAFSPHVEAQPVPRRPWRVALLTGGSAYEYQLALAGLAARAEELGLIDNGAVPKPAVDGSELQSMWTWLAEHAGGGSLRFVADAFYSAQWIPERREAARQALLARVRTAGDIDGILAFGTWAGQDIAQEDLSIPVIALSSTNAVEAGIAASPDDSGRDNLMAVVRSGTYVRQLKVFHKIFRFDTLGIVYEDTPSGRSSVALKEIEEAAAELGVELKRCTNLFDIPDPALGARRLRDCHEHLLAQGAQAVYLTYNLAMNDTHSAAVLEPLLRGRVPTFAQSGSAVVRMGALLSFSHKDYEREGFFVTDALAKILQGHTPRAMLQYYGGAFSLVVNVNTAARIGWNLPLEVLAAVDEFF